MIISVHNNKMLRVGFINNDSPDALHFKDDIWHQYLKEGASTFDFTVSKKINGKINSNYQIINDQSYISFNDNGKDYLFTIINLKDDDNYLYLKCNSQSFEMINEIANPYTATSPLSIVQYLDMMDLIKFSAITVNINELSNVTKTLKFESQETKLARLISLIEQFNGEFEFNTILNQDGTLKTTQLNLYRANNGIDIQGVGKVSKNLYYGKNILGVERETDKTQVFNATLVTGSNGLVVSTLDYSIKNDQGIEEFYIRKGSPMAYAPMSKDMYPSSMKIDQADQWIRKDFSITADNEQAIWEYQLEQLKKFAYPQIKYTVNASSKLVTIENLKIGDTHTIQDNNFDVATGGLNVRCRVTELVISRRNPENNSVVFDNFKKLNNQISADLLTRMSQLIDQSIPYRLEVWTTNGTVFKNKTGSTELQAHVFKGSDVAETTPDSIQWIADGMPISSGNGGNSPNLEVNASEIFQKSVISYQATFGTKTYNSSDITILDVSDGTSPINLVIESSNGYQFKNNIINTVLTARLYQDNNEIDTDGTEFSYVWTKVNSDGSIDTNWNLQHQAGSKSITITNSDLQQRATFDCLATSLF